MGKQTLHTIVYLTELLVIKDYDIVFSGLNNGCMVSYSELWDLMNFDFKNSIKIEFNKNRPKF